MDNIYLVKMRTKDGEYNKPIQAWDTYTAICRAITDMSAQNAKVLTLTCERIAENMTMDEWRRERAQ